MRSLLPASAFFSTTSAAALPPPPIWMRSPSNASPSIFSTEPSSTASTKCSSAPVTTLFPLISPVWRPLRLLIGIDSCRHSHSSPRLKDAIPPFSAINGAETCMANLPHGLPGFLISWR
ncbi:Afadin- and alpha -actinin-Binding [Musa troglodytarum]|uniref:Afadin- and alpha -actinin-Binding n=1 Tax=Musa troglodytarum TaxID=320322 RepID=A0A9E7GZ21_9LILI|nr:Afadin- and alpha -actinin-Binding [Musa troglodytarum]